MIFICTNILNENGPAGLLFGRTAKVHVNSIVEKYRLSEMLNSDVVLIKGGVFKLGCCEQSRQTKVSYDDNGNRIWCSKDCEFLTDVKLSDFCIGKYEVTNHDYVRFLNADNHLAEEVKSWINTEDAYCRIYKEGGRFFVKNGFEKHPVSFVTWFGATAYCHWKGGRLPTQAEWEYAALGGEKSKGYTYSGSNNIDDVAVYSESGVNIGYAKYISTMIVGSKKPNELGLFDMTGNVKEWCGDWYSDSYFKNDSLYTNPKGPATGTVKVTRGGCWGNAYYFSYVAKPSASSPENAWGSIGFRICFDKIRM